MIGNSMNVIETERLILRTWRNDVVDEYYRINQDPKVIELLRVKFPPLKKGD